MAKIIKSKEEYGCNYVIIASGVKITQRLQQVGWLGTGVKTD